jgi:hypothetical protein
MYDSQNVALTLRFSRTSRGAFGLRGEGGCAPDIGSAGRAWTRNGLVTWIHVTKIAPHAKSALCCGAVPSASQGLGAVVVDLSVP